MVKIYLFDPHVLCSSLIHVTFSSYKLILTPIKSKPSSATDFVSVNETSLKKTINKKEDKR